MNEQTRDGRKQGAGWKAGQLTSLVSHYPGACFLPGCPPAPWLLHTPKGPRPGARAAEESGICKEHRAERPAGQASPGPPSVRAAPARAIPGKPLVRPCFRPKEVPLSAGPALQEKLQAPGIGDSRFPTGSTEAPG